MLARDLQARARRKGRPSKVAALVSDHALTVAAMAAVDVAMFHLGFAQGWAAVGVSLLLADYKITG
jgi:hypothetical protein